MSKPKHAKQVETKRPRPTNHLSRRYLLDVTASGYVFIRKRGDGASPHGGLPVFSTDTEEEAKSLIVRNCRLARDDSGLYRLNEFKEDDVSELDRVTDLFKAQYENTKAGRNPFTGEER